MDQELRKALGSIKSRRIQKSGLVPSAVLVPLLEDGNEHHILFVRRSNNVKDHKGEISFPGGVVESGDRTRIDTALRECHEEIGVAPSDVVLLGQLDDMETITTGYVITPFVGRIPYPYAFRINSYEIAMLVIVPLTVILEATARDRLASNGVRHQPPSPVFYYQEHVIWGATARILLRLVDLIAPPPSGNLGHQ
jgi:8-oxo-dGTP pyrophosphatase MutT (NUDIX family)